MAHKYLILSLYTDCKPYKGHREAISYIATEIAKYNGCWYGDPDEMDSDKWILDLINEQKLSVEASDGNTTYTFGHEKTKGYVTYGKIIKTVLF